MLKVSRTSQLEVPFLLTSPTDCFKAALLGAYRFQLALLAGLSDGLGAFDFFVVSRGWKLYG